MKAILNLFKPAPHSEEISDPNVVHSQYAYWRVRIFYSMFIGYAFYYFTRKSFTFAMPGLMADLHYDKSQLGLLGSILYITYGMSKFASGILSDRSNPRYFMATGLILTGIFNILFGLSSSIVLFAIFWGLNGWFQGFGWPPCARFLTHWYSKSERGSWWSSWNVSHNIGAAAIPLVAGITLQYFGWRSVMFVPGILCIIVGLFLINRLRDTPQSLGLPPIEKYRDDYPEGESKDSVKDECELTAKQILFDYVLKNKFIWLLAIAYFFVYVVRTAINDWTALFLQESKGYSNIVGSGFVAIFDVGGFFGSLCAGWISDKLFKAKRGPVNVLFALGMLCSIVLFWFVPGGYEIAGYNVSMYLDGIAIFTAGFMVFGPQMLIGVAAAELSHKKAAATSTGFAGFFAYMGAASAGYPLGRIAQDFGWDGFFISIIVCCVLSIALLLPLWGATETSHTRTLSKKSPNLAKA